LLGEWEIDFTRPEFADAGIFAITGKTGAGKSSILDAISLALYGKTPRVEKITSENNDVMTRHTSDCYAEITFEIGGARWKSSWKQERSHNGKLKSVNRQIADGANKIHAEQVNHCNSKIIEIVGLTFEQFTKVIMLAQGSFAAFLQADKNTKGELLEHITGTEIYGEISRRAFERNKAEKEKLDRISDQIGEIKILSDDEKERLKSEITIFDTQKKQIDSEIQMIETAKKWLTDLMNLQTQIAEGKRQLPDLVQNVETVSIMLRQAEDSLREAKSEKENGDKIFVKVRELDTKIAEKEKLLIPVMQHIAQLDIQNNNLTNIIDNQRMKLAEAQGLLLQKQEWSAKHASYESLVGEFAAVKNQNDRVKEIVQDGKNKRIALDNAQKDRVSKVDTFDRELESFASLEKTFHEKDRELITAKASLSEILCNKELNAYQASKESLLKLNNQIEHLVVAVDVIYENRQKELKSGEMIASAEKSANELTQQIAADKNLRESIKNKIIILEENIRQIKEIQDMYTLRQSLEDGKPCPLCGSLDHPFAQGNEPRIGDNEMLLNSLKEHESQINETIQQNEGKLIKLMADWENALKNQESTATILSENLARRQLILNEIKTVQPDFDMPDDENTKTLLLSIQKQKQLEYRQIADILTKANQIDAFINHLRDNEFPILQQALQTAEKAKTEAATNKQLAEQQLKTRQQLMEEVQRKYVEENAKLHQNLNVYGASTIEILESYLTQWKENQSALESLKNQINQLENEIKVKNTEIANSQDLMKAKTEERQGLNTEKQLLVKSRHDLFDDRNVEDEERRLTESVMKAESARTDAEKAKTDVATELAKIQAVIAEKEKALAEKLSEQFTVKTLDELQAEYDSKKPQSDLLSRQTGANMQSLKVNEENVIRNSKKLEEKALQEQVCAKWGSLNMLIGSRDGIVYRNFAQALTFEHLIGLANRQLQRMSERYILKRVDNVERNPFELSVIDKFQNCEERTAQNLSGGEKFIVSLSLALGLANMASKNMKIDTMFIDEGFGTLDSDYLDVALSALSNLQNEGKLIGVISHLTELKERIATHIEVIPKGDGHSRIEMRW
jgi:exonuclease SbcC